MCDRQLIVLLCGIIFSAVADFDGAHDSDLYSISEDSPFLNDRSINIEGKYSRWSKRDRIPYYIDKSYSPTEAALIKTAISQIVSDLNYWVNFVSVDAQANEFKIKITPVKPDGFTPEKICYSFPGMLAVAQKLVTVGVKEQRMVLARGSTGCMDGTIHSIMKYLALVLGKRNEHQRGDRAKWIQMYPGNLTITGTAAYKQHTPRESNWGLFQYDYCSITHNQPEDYANPGTSAFAVLKPPYYIPKLNRLSESDCKILLMLYSGDPSACTPLNCGVLVSHQTTTQLPILTLNNIPATFLPPVIKAIPEAASPATVTSSPDGTTTVCQTFPTTILTTSTTVPSTPSSTTATTSATTTTSPITTPTTTTATSTATTPNVPSTELRSTAAPTCPPPVCPVCTCVSRCDPITTPPETSTTSRTTSATTSTTTPTTTSTTSTTSTRTMIAPKALVEDDEFIPRKCPGRMCSGQIDHAALFLDGETSLLISGECAQKVDKEFQLVGDMLPLTEAFPGGVVDGPIQSVWTNMREGQFRVHVIDNFGTQRSCTILGCDEEETRIIRPFGDVFAFQNGDSEDFRSFFIDVHGLTITDETAPAKPIHLSDIRGASFISHPLKSITTAWMMFTPTRNRSLAVIGRDKAGKQFIAELNVDLSQRPAVFSYIPDKPIMPLFAKLHPCR